MYQTRSFEVKSGMADILKGGIIVDVATEEEALVAEDAGALAVVIIENTDNSEIIQSALFPNAFNIANSFATPKHLQFISEVKARLSIPIIARCSKGHFAMAQMLEALNVDFLDESELLPPADEEYNINKLKFKVPFGCGAGSLNEALWHIVEGAAFVRTKQNVKGDISKSKNLKNSFEDNLNNIPRKSDGLSETVRQIRRIQKEIRCLAQLTEDELIRNVQEMSAPYHLLLQVAKQQKLPVPFFASLDTFSSCDIALVMQLGVESVFINNNVFKVPDPIHQIKTLRQAVQHCREPELLLKNSFETLVTMV